MRIDVDETLLLGQLETLAAGLDIEVRHENLSGETAPGAGGLCRYRGRNLLILNSQASLGEKIRVLARALKRFDLTHVYLKPALRDFLESDGEVRSK